MTFMVNNDINISVTLSLTYDSFLLEMIHTSGRTFRLSGFGKIFSDDVMDRVAWRLGFGLFMTVSPNVVWKSSIGIS